jgi:hypothetical protein
LIDRDATRPTSGSPASSHNVSRKEMVSGEEAAHAPHVIIAVSADFIKHSLENQGLIFEGF